MSSQLCAKLSKKRYRSLMSSMVAFAMVSIIEARPQYPFAGFPIAFPAGLAGQHFGHEAPSGGVGPFAVEGAYGSSGGGGAANVHHQPAATHSVGHDGGHQFGYAVQDPTHHNIQGRQEVASASAVQGTYYLMEADGNMRRVDYVADASGFRATVTDKRGTHLFGHGADYDVGPAAPQGLYNNDDGSGNYF